MGKSPRNGLLKIGFAVRADDAVGLHAVAAGEGEVGPDDPQAAVIATASVIQHGFAVIGIQTDAGAVWFAG